MRSRGFASVPYSRSSSGARLRQTFCSRENPTMTKRRRRFIIAAVAVVAAVSLPMALLRPSRDIKVSVHGDSNQRITARFDADGVVTEEVVAMPFQRTFAVNRLSFWFIPEREAPDSTIDVQITVDDVLWWPSNNNTLSLSQGVKGTLQTPGLFQVGRNQTGIAGTSREEIAAIGYHECVD